VGELGLHELLEARIRQLAPAYRRLVVWFGVQLLLDVGILALQGMSVGPARLLLDYALTTGSLIAAGALAYYAYRTAAAVASDVPWLWAIAMLIPCANVIALVALNSQAKRACRYHGIPVGLLGPKALASPRSGHGAA
jgi:pheromone shutdown protein TraB